MYLTDKQAEVLLKGRYKLFDNGLKISNEELSKCSLTYTKSLLFDINKMTFRLKENDNSFAKVLLSPKRTAYCFIKDNKCMFVVWDKKDDILTQKISIGEAKSLLRGESHMLSQIRNVYNINKKIPVDVEKVANSIKSSGIAMDDDFDITL